MAIKIQAKVEMYNVLLGGTLFDLFVMLTAKCSWKNLRQLFADQSKADGKKNRG